MTSISPRYWKVMFQSPPTRNCLKDPLKSVAFRLLQRFHFHHFFRHRRQRHARHQRSRSVTETESGLALLPGVTEDGPGMG